MAAPGAADAYPSAALALAGHLSVQSTAWPHACAPLPSAPLDLPQHSVSVLQHTAQPDPFHREGPLTHHPRPGTSVSLWGLMMPPLATHQCFYIFLMHFKANCKHLHPSL